MGIYGPWCKDLVVVAIGIMICLVIRFGPNGGPRGIVNTYTIIHSNEMMSMALDLARTSSGIIQVG